MQKAFSGGGFTPYRHCIFTQYKPILEIKCEVEDVLQSRVAQG